MSSRHPSEAIAARMLARTGAAIDPALLALLASLVIDTIKLLYECRNQPSPADIRAVCRKPTGVQRAIVWGKLAAGLGPAQFRALGGRRLVDAAFDATLASSDNDLRLLLHA